MQSRAHEGRRLASGYLAAFAQSAAARARKWLDHGRRLVLRIVLRIISHIILYLVEQPSEVAREIIVEHPHQRVGMGGLGDFEKAVQTMAAVVLANQARDRVVRERGQLGPERPPDFLKDFTKLGSRRRGAHHESASRTARHEI